MRSNDPNMCNSGLQCNTRKLCEKAQIKNGNGIRLIASPDGKFTCGSPDFIVKWEYTNKTFFVGKAGAELDVEIVLAQDTFGGNERVARLGVVRYPTAEFAVAFPTPFPVRNEILQ